MAYERTGRLFPAPQRGGMGESRAGRTRWRPLPVGERAALGERLRQAAARRGDAGQPLGARGALGRLSRVVPRLGERALLPDLTRATTSGAAARLAARLPRASRART